MRQIPAIQRCTYHQGHQNQDLNRPPRWPLSLLKLLELPEKAYGARGEEARRPCNLPGRLPFRPVIESRKQVDESSLRPDRLCHKSTMYVPSCMSHYHWAEVNLPFCTPRYCSLGMRASLRFSFIFICDTGLFHLSLLYLSFSPFFFLISPHFSLLSTSFLISKFSSCTGCQSYGTLDTVPRNTWPEEHVGR
jgi:hypothetical protein